MNHTLEICCSNLDGCIQTDKNGGSRIELCGSMSAGGLTPSIGLFKLAKKNCSIPIVVMIRPRGTGFCYDKNEINIMREDARIFLEHGADGIVFGFLTPKKTIDKENVKYLCELAHSYGKEAIFHKAIDETEDLIKEIEVLYELGVDRVLTSGGAGVAKDNIEIIKKIVEVFGNKMQILIGGGIRGNNILTIMKETGAMQIHSACRVMRQDPSINKSDVLNYDNAFDCVNGEEVDNMAKKMKEFIYAKENW